MRKTVVYLSEVMPLGGTSTFALNICDGMRETAKWGGIAAGLRKLGEVGEQIRALELPLIAPDPQAVLHEERIEHVYRECARHSPRAVVAALSAGSFDFLRFVPENCLRIGMIQSDEEGVYDLVSQYLPWLDAVAGVSREICRKMEERLDKRMIPVVHQPYGVPMPVETATRENSGPLRILYLGRVAEEQKRVSLMARVIRTSLGCGQGIEWTIAGDGPELGALKGALAGVDGVRFLGSVPYREVPGVMASHDVYFLCSDYEGLPLSLLEAMGAGLVPVVSDLPSGISEVVNERTGIRIGIHDEEGYGRALFQLAENPAWRMELSRNAATEVQASHSTAAMAARWETMLEELLPPQVPHWSPECRATPPLGVGSHWCFHPLLRPLRSRMKRFRVKHRPR